MRINPFREPRRLTEAQCVTEGCSWMHFSQEVTNGQGHWQRGTHTMELVNKHLRRYPDHRIKVSKITHYSQPTKNVV
jgi:hypothetical protein